MANCKTCLHAAVCGKRIATGGHVKECKQFMEKKTGRWVINQYGKGPGDYTCYCSECKTEGSLTWKRCPVCKADMRGDSDERE